MNGSMNSTAPICRQMARFLAVAAFSGLVSLPVLSDCTCHPAPEGETTRPGANRFIVLDDTKIHKNLQGIVGNWLEAMPIEGVLVEIFDHPEYLLSASLSDPSIQIAIPIPQKRITACITSSDGKFCFRNLPSGKYELRASLDGGWNVTHVYVIVDKKAGKRGKLRVRMTVGT